MKSGDGNATIARYLKAVRERKDIVRGLVIEILLQLQYSIV